jgi:hypothetical protein
VTIKSSGFFFNTRAFVMRNPEHKIISFPLNAPAPYIYFTWHNNELVSLTKSTFGGFIATENPNHIAATISEFTEWARGNYVTSITIRSFPEIYSKEESMIIKRELLAAGFQIIFDDVTQFVRVTEDVLPLNTHRKRRLRKCMDQGFTFKQLGKESLADAYSLFLESRENKQYPVTMSLHDFQQAFEKFPDHYLLFGVFDQQKIIAACVAVIIDNEILYSFFIGDTLTYRIHSPVTQLMEGIYRFAQNRKMSILDFGISTDKGVLNNGLYEFKKSLGAKDSHKLTYQITL